MVAANDNKERGHQYMFFKSKDISNCEILEKYKIDIDDVNRLYRIGLPSSQSGPREYCELVAKDNRYNFYGYRTYSDGSGGYILRQEIKNQKKVVFFGKCKKHNIVYNGYLFQVNEHGEVGDYNIIARNIEDGKLIEYEWLSDKAIYVSVNGFGRFNCQDQVKKVFIKDDKLIFTVSRTKSKDPYHEYQPDKYDINTQYNLVVEYKAGRFVATKVFLDDAASEGKQEKPSDTKLASTLQTNKDNSISTGTGNSALQTNNTKNKYWMDNMVAGMERLMYVITALVIMEMMMAKAWMYMKRH